jgi:hypothetical protein
MQDGLARVARLLGKTPGEVEAAWSLYKEESDFKKKLPVFMDVLSIDEGPARNSVGMLRSDEKRFGNGHSDEPTLPSIPLEFRETLSVMTSVEKLRQRRLGLEHQIDDLRKEQSKIDEELRIYQPVLEKAALLQKAVHQMRQEVRKEAR